MRGQGAWAQAMFLSAAGHGWLQPRVLAVADDQAADAFRAVEFVRGQGQQVDRGLL